MYEGTALAQNFRRAISRLLPACAALASSSFTPRNDNHYLPFTKLMAQCVLT